VVSQNKQYEVNLVGQTLEEKHDLYIGYNHRME